MSYNGTGIYTLPGAQLINGEVVSATENNQFRNDVASALNTAWTRDGQAPATNNIPMANHKLTGLSAGTENGDSVRFEQVTSGVNITGGTIKGVTTPGNWQFENVKYTGTLTGGAGIINIDSGKFYKDASGKFGFNTTSPTEAVDVNGVVKTSVGVTYPDGKLQTAAYRVSTWSQFTATGTYTVPTGITKIRAYAFGAGGNGAGTAGSGGGGGGGGCAFGDITVSPGDTVSISISSGVATVAIGGTTYLTANNGTSGTSGSAGAGGTATKHASVSNGGAYTGGSGGAGYGAGGGSSGSPLGNGYTGATAANGGGGAGAGGNGGGGGGGAGGAGQNLLGGLAGAGGAGGSAGGSPFGSPAGIGRNSYNRFSDPLMEICDSPGGDYGYWIGGDGGNGGGGGFGNGNAASTTGVGGCGGMFGGGGGATAPSGNYAIGGNGGFGGGGGGGVTSAYAVGGGAGGYGGGGGASTSGSAGGAGGAAIVLIYV